MGILYHYGLAKLSGFVLFLCVAFYAEAQNDSTYSFLVAGHAYGAHSGDNIGLHPPFLEKLSEEPDSNIMGIFLTGDIVNHSTSASRNQVENELSTLKLSSYYVMGNHDNNSIGYQVFKDKHGGDYYYFIYKNELYIILNSTESDRSISQIQLQFLDDILENKDLMWDRAFVFFHEVIWNSKKKYQAVRSNSRSRYDKLVNISNFWNEVYPRLSILDQKKFYLFAGDVGGNPDAIAASYDCWENVTLVSSGMGEVSDENYLKVSVLPDSITFQIIPLNDEVEIYPITWYNIPEKPDSIFGPSSIFPNQSDVNYRIEPIDNATSYNWDLSAGIYGSSDFPEINLRFSSDFQSGHISVTAVNDGFGESEKAELFVFSDSNTTLIENEIVQQLRIKHNQTSIQLNFNSDRIQTSWIKIYDLSGRVVFNERVLLNTGLNSRKIHKTLIGKGLFILQLTVNNEFFTEKIVLH